MSPTDLNGNGEALVFTEHLSRTVEGPGESDQDALTRNHLFADFSDNLRAMMYGLSVLCTSPGGISAKETEVLSFVAASLDLPAPAKQRIDDAIGKAPSSAAGLAALLEAYSAAQSSRAAPGRREIGDLQAEAQKNIFSLPMLDAAEVSTMLGSRSKNNRQYAARLRHDGVILGLRHSNRYVYPRFQFDETRQQAYPAIKAVGQILGSGRDPWAVASWWISPSPRLPAGQSPSKLLGTKNDTHQLAALARAMVADVG